MTLTCSLAHAHECVGVVRQYMNHRGCDLAAVPQPTPDPARSYQGLKRAHGTWHDLPTDTNPRGRGQEYATKARDAALAAVESTTPDTWKDAARRAVWHLACTRATFNADDVWEELERRNVPAPPEPRALGPVLMRALRANAIRDTGRMTPSRRRHASKITLYERTPR